MHRPNCSVGQTAPGQLAFMLIGDIAQGAGCISSCLAQYGQLVEHVITTARVKGFVPTGATDAKKSMHSQYCMAQSTNISHLPRIINLFQKAG